MFQDIELKEFQVLLLSLSIIQGINKLIIHKIHEKNNILFSKGKLIIQNFNFFA